MIETETDSHNFPFERSFMILGYIFNPARKMQDSLEEIMNATCERSLVERREDLQKQRYTVENNMQENGGHLVYSVYCFGSENCSWSTAILERIEGGETKVMRRLFRFNRKEE